MSQILQAPALTNSQLDSFAPTFFELLESYRSKNEGTATTEPSASQPVSSPVCQPSTLTCRPWYSERFTDALQSYRQGIYDYKTWDGTSQLSLKPLPEELLPDYTSSGSSPLFSAESVSPSISPRQSSEDDLEASAGSLYSGWEVGQAGAIKLFAQCVKRPLSNVSTGLPDSLKPLVRPCSIAYMERSLGVRDDAAQTQFLTDTSSFLEDVVRKTYCTSKAFAHARMNKDERDM